MDIHTHTATDAHTNRIKVEMVDGAVQKVMQKKKEKFDAM